MAGASLNRTVPAWLLPVVVGVGALVLAVVIWRAFTGTTGSAGPPKEVRPGMYDFRAEAQKGNLGRRDH